MSIGKIISVKKLIDSNILENQQLVFAIMKGPDVTSKQRVKYLEYLFKFESLYISSSSLYFQALTEFKDDILHYDFRKRSINSAKTTKL